MADLAPHATAQWPAGVPETGDAGADKVLAGALALASIPVAEHTDTYAALHDALKAELDADPSTALAGR